ncbi:MAG: HAD-IIIA family hydrolase [Verrucomicrobiales bacterium]|nr:HAD-IIIA family hydrolase [Verrucomicrobiales bacterium]
MPGGEAARGVAVATVTRMVDVLGVERVELGDVEGEDGAVVCEGVMHLELEERVAEVLVDCGFVDPAGVEEVMGELDVVMPLGEDGDVERVARRIEELGLAAEARANPGEVSHVFLDRDGVLNREGGHVTSVEGLEVLPGVGEAVARLNVAGVGCSVVTNQSGLARGIVTEAELGRIHAKLVGAIEEAGGRIERVYVSPYLDKADGLGEGAVTKWVRASDQRKPRSGMLFRAARELGLKLGDCVMVGDSRRDLQAAEGAGVRFYGVRSAKAESFGGGVKLYEGLGEVVGEMLKS